MKNNINYQIIVVIIMFAILPGLAHAQTFDERMASNYQDHRQQSSDLQQKIATLPSTADASINMPVLFGVGVKDISPNFGTWSTVTNRAHAGEDIMAIRGTPIVSPTAAVVTLVSPNLSSSEGNAVYTANPGGESFVYYHLDRIGEGVVPGLVLEQGSLIGYVGNTGTSAVGVAPHLHFEIHNSAGVATDPFTRLALEFTPTQKISFLTKIFTQTSDPVALSQLLVANFRSTFTADMQNGVVLPSLITDAIQKINSQTSDISLSNQQLIAQIKQQLIVLMTQAIQLFQIKISLMTAR